MSTGPLSGERVVLRIQGVNLDDDRWENTFSRFHTHRRGVWELRRGTEMLPRYSGGRPTRWEVPGGQGEHRAALVPLAARIIPIRVRFWPICTNPASQMYQRTGRDPQERARFLRENITEFQRRIQVARQMAEGDLRLDRIVGGDGSQRVSAAIYFESDWPQEDGPGYAYSDLTIPARNRAGTWFADWEYIQLGTVRPEDGLVAVDVPMGDAPVEDAKIAIRPVGDAPPVGQQWFEVTNRSGYGFRAARTTPWTRWWIFDTLNSRAGYSATGADSDRDWDIPTRRDDVMFSVKPRQGTSLFLTPGVSGDGRPVGRVNVRVGAPARVIIALRPKYF